MCVCVCVYVRMCLCARTAVLGRSLLTASVSYAPPAPTSDSVTVVECADDVNFNYNWSLKACVGALAEFIENFKVGYLFKTEAAWTYILAIHQGAWRGTFFFG